MTATGRKLLRKSESAFSGWRADASYYLAVALGAVRERLSVYF